MPLGWTTFIPLGGIPERSKGTDCKSVGSAFAGSNPAPATSQIWPVSRDARVPNGYRKRKRPRAARLLPTSAARRGLDAVLAPRGFCGVREFDCCRGSRVDVNVQLADRREEAAVVIANARPPVALRAGLRVTALSNGVLVQMLEDVPQVLRMGNVLAEARERRIYR